MRLQFSKIKGSVALIFGFNLQNSVTKTNLQKIINVF